MMSVLLTGTLIRPATFRTSQAGQPFATALMRVPHAETESSLANLIVFDESAQNAIKGLCAGDSLSVAGTARLTSWVKDGETRHGIGVVASQVMTLYQTTARKKRAKQVASVPAAQDEHVGFGSDAP